MATEEPSTSAIDETPISPVERVNSLEKHLQTRPEVQDLKNRNILHDTSAAPYALFILRYCVLPIRAKHFLKGVLWTDAGHRALQAAQLELERNRTVDSLKKGLERRPERDELVQRTPPHASHGCCRPIPQSLSAPAAS